MAAEITYARLIPARSILRNVLIRKNAPERGREMNEEGRISPGYGFLDKAPA
jgi:hypothetical protein